MCWGVASYSYLQCDAKIEDMMQCSPSTLGRCNATQTKSDAVLSAIQIGVDSDAFVIEKLERYDGASVQPREGIPQSNTMLLVQQPWTWMLSSASSAQIKTDGIIRRGA